MIYFQHVFSSSLSPSPSPCFVSTIGLLLVLSQSTVSPVSASASTTTSTITATITATATTIPIPDYSQEIWTVILPTCIILVATVSGALPRLVQILWLGRTQSSSRWVGNGDDDMESGNHRVDVGKQAVVTTLQLVLRGMGPLFAAVWAMRRSSFTNQQAVFLLPGNNDGERTSTNHFWTPQECQKWHHQVQAAALKKTGWKTLHSQSLLDTLSTLSCQDVTPDGPAVDALWQDLTRRFDEVFQSTPVTSPSPLEQVLPRIQPPMQLHHLEWHLYKAEEDVEPYFYNPSVGDMTLMVLVAGEQLKLQVWRDFRSGNRHDTTTISLAGPGQAVLLDAQLTRQVSTAEDDRIVLVVHWSLQGSNVWSTWIWKQMWKMRRQWHRPVVVHHLPLPSEGTTTPLTKLIRSGMTAYMSSIPLREYPSHQQTFQETRKYGVFQKLPQDDPQQARQVYRILKRMQETDPHPECRNHDARCAIMAAMGSCDRGSHKYMAEYCAPVCGKCGL